MEGIDNKPFGMKSKRVECKCGVTNSANNRCARMKSLKHHNYEYFKKCEILCVMRDTIEGEKSTIIASG